MADKDLLHNAPSNIFYLPSLFQKILSQKKENRPFYNVILKIHTLRAPQIKSSSVGIIMCFDKNCWRREKGYLWQRNGEDTCTWATWVRVSSNVSTSSGSQQRHTTTATIDYLKAFHTAHLNMGKLKLWILQVLYSGNNCCLLLFFYKKRRYNVLLCLFSNVRWIVGISMEYLCIFRSTSCKLYAHWIKNGWYVIFKNWNTQNAKCIICQTYKKLDKLCGIR